MIGYIYCLKYGNSIFYIGSTEDPEARLIAHKTCAKSGKSPVYKYIRSNGSFFEMEILEKIVCSCRADILAKEADWIRRLVKIGNNLENFFYTGKKAKRNLKSSALVYVKISRRSFNEAKKQCESNGIDLYDYIDRAVSKYNKNNEHLYNGLADIGQAY